MRAAALDGAVPPPPRLEYADHRVAAKIRISRSSNLMLRFLAICLFCASASAFQAPASGLVPRRWGSPRPTRSFPSSSMSLWACVWPPRICCDNTWQQQPVAPSDSRYPSLPLQRARGRGRDELAELR